MSFKFILSFLAIFLSLSTWAKTFPGHIKYEVTYNKEPANISTPKDMETDVYAGVDGYIVEVLTLEKGVKKKYRYNVNYKLNRLTIIDLTAKTISHAFYNKIPPIKYTELEPKTKPTVMTHLGEQLEAKYFKSATGEVLSGWYSSYKLPAHKETRLEVEMLADPKTGQVALIMTREVEKGVTAIYKAKVVDSNIPKEIFTEPKGFKEIKGPR